MAGSKELDVRLRVGCKRPRPWDSRLYDDYAKLGQQNWKWYLFMGICRAMCM